MAMAWIDPVTFKQFLVPNMEQKRTFIIDFVIIKLLITPSPFLQPAALLDPRAQVCPD